MGKTILYKLFKIGSIPKKLRPMLEAEGFVVYDEGVSGSLFMKDFKSPWRRAKYRKELFSGFLAVTKKRVIAQAYWKRVVNIPLDHKKFQLIEIELVNPKCIEFAFESSDFYADWTGRIVLRFNTLKAQGFYRVLKHA